jgi:serine/threonine protein kinase
LELDGLDENKASFNINSSLMEISFSEIKIEKKIGQGGSGCIVFSGAYEGLQVAVKVFKVTSLDGSKFFKEFESEAMLLSSLRSPYIVNFYGVSLNYPRIGIVLELCKCSLADLINTKQIQNESKQEILYQICKGMAFLHRKKIIFRDLKCDNVLVAQDRTMKLTDFGLAKLIGDQKKDLTSNVGTSYYMAPEVLNDTNYTNSCDVFSFGIVMFEVLTEKMNPYEETSMQVQYKTASDPLFRPDLKKLSKEDREQYGDVMEQCWSHEVGLRLKFDDLVGFFKNK